MKRQAGLALVIVIWVLSLLTIMAGSFALSMRRETTVISAVKDNAAALAAAEGALQLAQQMLLLTDVNKRWRIDGSIYEVAYRDAEIRVRILSEQGKIDINKADETVLTKLVASTSLESEQQQALVSAIMDWRDPDDLVRLNGAEKEEYEEASLSYQPFNRDFQFVEELQLVLGMNSELYQELHPLVTVYSGVAQVNLQFASNEILPVVSDLPEDELEEYMQQRVDNARMDLPPPQLPQTGNANSQGGSDIGVYTVIAQARLNGENMAGIQVVIKRAGGGNPLQPFQVLERRQTDQESSLFSDDMEQLLVTVQDESGQQY